jgi:bacteriocin-like protein
MELTAMYSNQFIELTDDELEAIDGGGLIGAIIGGVLGAAVGGIAGITFGVVIAVDVIRQGYPIGNALVLAASAAVIGLVGGTLVGAIAGGFVSGPF